MQKTKALKSISGLDQKIKEAIISIPSSDRYFIALSGGMDSIALAYFCVPYLKEKTTNIQAIHINHNLSPNAQAWADFCEICCLELGIACHVVNVSVVSEGEGLEAAARKARYAEFNRYLQEGGVLLQGHHLNDQAETVLMRFLKGLGPESLKGIPKERAISNGLLYRPWLDIPRESLVSEVKQRKLSWVEDESNQDVRYERNYLRNEVLPLLRKRHSSIFDDLGRVAKKSQDTSEFIYEWCDTHKNSFLSDRYSEQLAIDISSLKSHSNIQQTFILRYWFDLLGFGHPTEGSFQRIFDDLLSAKNDSKAEIYWKGNVLKVYDGALFCIPESFKVEVNYNHKLCLPEFSEQLMIKELPHGKLSISLIEACKASSRDHRTGYNKVKACYEVYCYIPDDIKYLTVRPRKGGDKIYLHAKHSAALKKLYQSNKVLPWHREKLPVVCAEDTLIASLAGFIAKGFRYESKEFSSNLPPSRAFCFRFEFT